MKAPSNGFGFSPSEGERKNMHSELWHACAGPLISLPPVGSLVVYFPQGHSEQVAASMQKQADILPSYPNLPPKLICLLHNVTLHADPETDEVYAQMTLQPVNKYDKEALLASDMGLKQNRQPSEFFCKTLTASDTSTHGGFSVPRRAAEKIFPSLDFSMQPPAQEIVAKDIHDSTWTFRHIYRGQPKRHLLTTGWSVFVSTKRLFAGDSVLFIRDEKSQLLLGIRRANRQQPTLSSSVISSDSMHIGILAAAAHAAANSSPFTIFYNPRASPSEFVVPLAKYNKAMYTQVSLGMRFRMLFETEECGVRRYMGTITGITDLDPVRWKNSQWRNLQVGWDESTAGDRPSRVSMWDIEPVVTPFYICPPPFFRPKFPRQPGMPEDESDMENAFKRAMPWLGDEFGMKDASSSIFPGLSLVQWMGMQQNNQFGAAQSGLFPSMVSSPSLPNNVITDDPSKLLNFQSPGLSTPNLYLNKQNPLNQLNQAPQTPPWPQHQQSQLQHQHQRLQHQQQQQLLQGSVQNNGMVASNHGGNPNMHQSNGYSQSQSQSQPQHISEQLCTSGAPTSHNMVSTNKFSSQLISSTPELQFQQHMEQHHQQQPNSLLQRSQQQQSQLQRQHSLLQQQQSQLQQESALHLLQRSLSQKSQHSQLQPLSQPDFSKQQLQLQQLQKWQQQQEQSVSPGGSVLQQQQHNQPPSLPSQSLAQQQNQQSQQMALSQAQSPPGNCMTSKLMQAPQISMHKAQNKLVGAVRAGTGLTDGDAPSRSTSPTGNNNGHGSSSNFFSKNQQGPALLTSESVFEPTNNLAQDLHIKPDNRIRQDLASLKGTNQLKYKGAVTDQLDVSSSGASYMDVGTAQQNLSSPTFGLDNDVQSHSRNNMPFATNIDALTTPETLLSRGYGSQKDFQNMLPNYGGSARDIETELSSAAISSQSFGVPNIPFNPGCSNDVAINDVPINDAGVLNGGMWGTNQTQRMRTYTKVQKRGSVGRSIDVTRYRGYDELRQDLGRMFGIEGQIEDPQTCDWKLVYVDHENDILLVGDDPWEEFVNCVQSIKILSSAEVQQMSLDGDLAGGSVPNQACSGTDSENAWKIHYDDNSAVSFNR